MGPNRRAQDREEAAAEKAKAQARRKDDEAARDDAERAIVEWNGRLQRGEPTWAVPTIGAALTAGYPWLSIYCGGCQTVQDIDLRSVDRHPAAAVTSLTLSMRCLRCNGHGPMPVAVGLAKFKPDPARKAGDVA